MKEDCYGVSVVASTLNGLMAFLSVSFCARFVAHGGHSFEMELILVSVLQLMLRSLKVV